MNCNRKNSTYSLSMTKHVTSPAAITFTPRTSSLQTDDIHDVINAMWTKSHSYHAGTNTTSYHHSCFHKKKLLYPLYNFLSKCMISFLPPQSLFSKPLPLRELRQDYLLFDAGLLFCHFHLVNPKERGHENEVMVDSDVEKSQSQLSPSQCNFLNCSDILSSTI